MQQIRARRLLAGGPDTTIRYDASIRFDAGGILSVEAQPRAGEGGLADELVMPSLCNAHDHGRGLKPIAYGARDHTVEAWVPATYTLPRIDPYLVAVAAFGRMAQAGIGSVVHCHLSRGKEALIEEAQAVCRAAREVGVRVAFVVPLRDRHRLAYAPDERVLACIEEGDRGRVAAQWLRPIPPIDEQLAAVEEIASFCENQMFTVQYGPVGVEWCSPELLREVALRSAADGRRVHMHLLESKYQRQWSDREYGGVVDYLAKIELLTPRLTVAHGTWLQPQECQVLAAHGVTVSVNTSSNLRLRSGIAPVPAMHSAGLVFGLGLDALALDDDEDLLREMRLAYLLHRGIGFEESLDADRMLAAATAGGEIRPGAAADFLVLDFARMTRDSADGLYREIDVLFARARAAHVRSLHVAGREIVRDGRVLGVDLPAIESALAQELQRVAPQLAELRPLLARFQSALGRFYQEGGHLR